MNAQEIVVALECASVMEDLGDFPTPGFGPNIARFIRFSVDEIQRLGTENDKLRADLAARDAEIADLKRGGVVAPVKPREIRDLNGEELRGISLIMWHRGWDSLASRLCTIPADRVLGEGCVSVDREWSDLVGQLHMTALDFVNDADPGQRRAAAPLVRAVAALRLYSDALRAHPTQEPAP